MQNLTLSTLLALCMATILTLLLGLDQWQFFMLFVGWYFYLRIGDRFDSLTIAVESLQDALQRIEAKNDTVPSKNSSDQNENVRISSNRHQKRNQE